MKIFGVLLLFLFSLTACSEKKDHKGKTPLVEIDGQFLYREDLQSVLPPGLSKDDSVLFAEHYIKNWAEGVLLYEKAESNIPENSRIDQLVENYRKALIIHTYQQELIDQQLSEEISDAEIESYYQANKELFTVDRPLIKGLFIKVPLQAPGVNTVRGLYKKNNAEAIDKLEKYSLQNAVSYDYFYDKWLPIADVVDKIPLKAEDTNAYIDKNREIEVKDSAYHYFLHIEDYLRPGAQKPLEYCKVEIKDMLTNLKRVKFMREMKNDLYKNAVNKEKIIYYY